MSTGFSNVSTTASDARIKLKLVRELSSFISRGFDKYGLPSPDVRWASVTNAIQACLAESILQGATERMPEEAVRERVIAAYLDEYGRNCQLFLKDEVLPTAVTHWAEESALIQKRFGSQAAYKTVAPSLDGALEMAWMNLRRAQQRWICWLCLGAMLYSTPQGRERSSAECNDFDRAAKALLNDVRLMEKRMLMFALLKGGEAAEQAKAWLLKTTLSAGMSVMEYLEYDGQVPSSWRTADEQALRATFAGQ